MYVYVCMYECMYVCMYACMHACMHVCIYVCIYIYIYIYVDILAGRGAARSSTRTTWTSGCPSRAPEAAPSRRPPTASPPGFQTGSGQTGFSQRGHKFHTFCNILFYVRMCWHILQFSLDAAVFRSKIRTSLCLAQGQSYPGGGGNLWFLQGGPHNKIGLECLWCGKSYHSCGYWPHARAMKWASGKPPLRSSRAARSS